MEYIHALRNTQASRRTLDSAPPNTVVSVTPWPWPRSSALIFSFSVEGTYGGGDSIEPELEMTPLLGKFFNGNETQATFVILGKIAEEHPDMVKSLQLSQQDIGGHGYSHCFLDELSAKEQETEITRTRRIIHEVSGHSIIGWSSPYCNYTKDTYDILSDKGFKWTSNWGRSLWGCMPFRPVIDEKAYDLIEIPAEDIHFDNLYRKFKMTPKQVETLWLSHLNRSIYRNDLFHLCAHPVNLTDNRAEPIFNVLNAALKSNKAWVASCTQISERWRAFENIKFSVNIQDNKDYLQIKGIVENQNDADMADWAIRIRTVLNIKEVEGSAECFIDEGRRKALIRIPKIGGGSSDSIDASVVLDLNAKETT
jgi:peptidoglycan/xylan/chitin deacetylase (PgdA/CDA1 family)